MAYSNMGTPVFYVDNYLYHRTIGTDFPNLVGIANTLTTSAYWNISDIPELFTLTPQFTKNVNYHDTSQY